jgi:hypothetical protein
MRIFPILDMAKFRRHLSLVKYMKINDLFERVSTNILVVDVQPAYAHHCNRVISGVCDLLNNGIGKKVVYYNGNGLTDDSSGDVIDYMCENDLDPNNVDDITWLEKEYGFFRGFMDNGISDHIIIKVVRAMVTQRTHDSRDLDLSTILEPSEFEQVEDYLDDAIYMPYWANVSELKQMSPFYMCGGGRNECLREIELICNAFNIRYRRLQNLIY